MSSLQSHRQFSCMARMQINIREGWRETGGGSTQVGGKRYTKESGRNNEINARNAVAGYREQRRQGEEACIQHREIDVGREREDKTTQRQLRNRERKQQRRT